MHDPIWDGRDAPDLAVLGWPAAVRRLDPAIHDLDQLDPARVLRVDAARLLVAFGDGQQPGHVLDRTGADVTTVVGDWVLVARPSAEGALRRAQVLVPRAGTIARRRDAGSGGVQVLAANVDVAVIVESISPQEANLGRLRRLVLLAMAGGSEPLIALSKCDLHDDPHTASAGVAGNLRDLLRPSNIVLVSGEDGTGVFELERRIPHGCTAVLVGASGAGKSTLANQLMRSDVQATGHVRGQTGTGRHVTSAGQLLVLPGGGILIDTPGIRGIGMHHGVDADELISNDIHDTAAGCRFSDCAHAREPGCAVQAAIAAGDLSETTLHEWRALARERAREAAKHDVRLRAARSSEMRRQGRHYAQIKRANPKGRNR